MELPEHLTQPLVLEEKTCRRCQIPKAINQFSVNRKTPDHHSHICRECTRLRRKPKKLNIVSKEQRPIKDQPKYAAIAYRQHHMCAVPGCRRKGEPRLNFYKLVGTTIEALICLPCLTIIQQAGANPKRLVELAIFLWPSYQPITTINIERRTDE